MLRHARAKKLLTLSSIFHSTDQVSDAELASYVTFVRVTLEEAAPPAQPAVVNPALLAPVQAALAPQFTQLGDQIRQLQVTSTNSEARQLNQNVHAGADFITALLVAPLAAGAVAAPPR